MNAFLAVMFYALPFSRPPLPLPWVRWQYGSWSFSPQPISEAMYAFLLSTCSWLYRALLLEVISSLFSLVVLSAPTSLYGYVLRHITSAVFSAFSLSRIAHITYLSGVSVFSPLAANGSRSPLSSSCTWMSVSSILTRVIFLFNCRFWSESHISIGFRLVYWWWRADSFTAA